ncbi:uncharacterized protein [Littorina saxatilis]|uniref:uncharacterized protein n=1 Tax=Littorina saxatilis TaxID=31220 RepID=UPI0038B450E8
MEHLELLKKLDDTVVICSGSNVTSGDRRLVCGFAQKGYVVNVTHSSKGTTVIVTNPERSFKDGQYVVKISTTNAKESVPCNAGFVPVLNISILAIVAGVIVLFRITSL